MDTRRRTTPWVALALILVATVAVYRGVIANGFVLDDAHSVRDNPSVRSLALVGRWVTSPYAVSSGRGSQNYRPVTVASYALDRAAWGEGPAGFHATNLAIHLGVVGLTFVLARRLWGDDWAAVGAAGVVALHPLNAEAVNYVTARSSSLMTLGVLAAVWAHDRATVERRRGWAGAAWMFGLLALGAKEAAVILPGLIIAWDRARGDGTEPWGATLQRSLPWWGLVGGFVAVRAGVLAVGHATAVVGVGASGSQGLWLALKIYLTSLGQWLWPVGLAVDHAWPKAVGGTEAGLLAAGAVVAGLGTLAAARWDRRMGWCLVWFWVAMLPMGVLPFVSRFTLYQDNRVYLAEIGLAWSTAWGLTWAVRRWGTAWAGRLTGLAVVGGLVVVVVWTDVVRTAVWTDEAHLWDDVLAKYPDSPLAHNAKGTLLTEAGRLEEARDAFEHALRLAPRSALVHGSLGVLFARRGDWERSAVSFENALKISPLYTFAQLRLAEAYEHQGRVDKALALYERVLQNDPEWTTGLVRSATLLERQGQWDEAVARYRWALRIDPDEDEARVRLGAALMAKGKWADARDVFAALLARRPDSYAARFYIGLTYARQGQDDRALAAWRDAVPLNRDDHDLLLELGLLYARRGQWSDAIGWYDQALNLDPGMVSAHLNLASAAERLGDVGRARSHYLAVLNVARPGMTDEALRAEARAALGRLSRLALPGSEERAGGEGR